MSGAVTDAHTIDKRIVRLGIALKWLLVEPIAARHAAADEARALPDRCRDTP
jgi:hypothetical protein